MSKHTHDQTRQYCKRGIIFGLFVFAVVAVGGVFFSPQASAQAAPATPTTINVPSSNAAYQCGSGKNAVRTSINFGCRGKSCKSANKDGCSALLDATFAIIRFLSAGVGILIIASTVWAGIQYGSARDDPSATAKAKERIRNNAFALLMFIFGYAILNYIIPAGFFK